MRTKSTFDPNDHEEFRFPRKIFLLIVLISIAMISVVAYSFTLGYEMTTNFSPLVDAAMETKLEATTAHLWFEEMISHDPSITIDDVMKHIDNAIWYVNAMLEGGKNPEGTFMPLTDPILRTQIEDVLKKLYIFRDITIERYKATETSGIGTPIDQRYDAIFISFENQADLVETGLQKAIADDLRQYRILQLFLILALLLLAGIHLLVFYRYEKQRTNNLKLIGEQYAHLNSLKGLIPICALCKQIRDDMVYWNKLERYLSKHSDTQVKHSICLECSKKFDPSISSDW